MKLVEVMACVDRVAKNGTNDTQHYKYAMASDVYDAVRGELAKRFVLMVPHIEKTEFVDKATRSGGTQVLCTMHVTFNFVDAESGETMAVLAVGQGSDSLDKASYKALTGATKQCLVQTFLIPTGDDPENESKPRKPEPPPPAGLASVKAKMPTAAPSNSSVRAAHDRTLAYPFGNCKGLPISDPRVDDKSIAFWLKRCHEELADASKSKFHETARKRIATLEAEQRYRIAVAAEQAGALPDNSPPPDDVPPPTDADAPF